MKFDSYKLIALFFFCLLCHVMTVYKISFFLCVHFLLETSITNHSLILTLRATSFR